MRITQENRLNRIAKKYADISNGNKYLVHASLKKVLEAKTLDEKIYSLEFLLNQMAKEQEKAVQKTYEFNAGDPMHWHPDYDNYDVNGKQVDRCTICARILGKNQFYVEVHNGGDLAAVGTADEYDAGYMGCWPIGSECAKKFAPELVRQWEN